MAAKVIPATSKDVRAYFVKHPEKVPAGAEKSVQVSCKGRIKPSAVEVFNKDKSHGMKYVEGQKNIVPLTYKAKNHRMVTTHLPRAEVRALAGKPGSKGPLSKADMAFAGEVLASR